MTLLRRDDTGAVALLTVNRPEVLNALSRDLLFALDRECELLAVDRRIRTVVVTGAGDRAFCAGADINELEGISGAQAFEFMRFGQRVFDRLASLPQPVIAAVNGVALGGGCELALACDVRLVARTAKLGQPEITLANVPGWGGTQRLPRVVGPGRAYEMILSGRAIDAETALAWGLANRVVDSGQLLDDAVAFAQTLASRSPTALAGAKRAIAFGMEHGHAAGLLAEAEAVARCCTTVEQNTAVASFIARKRSSSTLQGNYHGRSDARREESEC